MAAYFTWWCAFPLPPLLFDNSEMLIKRTSRRRETIVGITNEAN